ncbi:Zn-ribbon domain-containing OB-fold protein [Zhengella sp. ZM62]|uniref:Zn-ribbon domain-containing OB-fold protein n=1 Tax=Zhengella sedimenti TaxID=3390035 RepID=UPI0039763E26
MSLAPTPLPAKPLPRIEGPERPFWEGLLEGVIRVQHCLSCGRPRFPASRYCPHCHSPESEWRAVDPHGEVETYCVFHKAYFPGFVPEMPYAVVQVRLDCGVRFFSNMVGIGNDEIRTGMRVRAVFETAAPGIALLKFRPEGDQR